MATEDNGMPKMPKSLRWFFGIFMALFFIAIGVLLLVNGLFGAIYDPSWYWLRWAGGPIFILYGIFRGYRMIKN